MWVVHVNTFFSISFRHGVLGIPWISRNHCQSIRVVQLQLELLFFSCATYFFLFSTSRSLHFDKQNQIVFSLLDVLTRFSFATIRKLDQIYAVHQMNTVIWNTQNIIVLTFRAISCIQNNIYKLKFLINNEWDFKLKYHRQKNHQQ